MVVLSDGKWWQTWRQIVANSGERWQSVVADGGKAMTGDGRLTRSMKKELINVK